MQRESRTARRLVGRPEALVVIGPDHADFASVIEHELSFVEILCAVRDELNKCELQRAHIVIASVHHLRRCPSLTVEGVPAVALYAHASEIPEALGLGVHGVVSRDSPARVVVQASLAVLDGHVVVPTNLLPALKELCGPAPSTLSPEDRLLLSHLSAGDALQDVAQRLHMSDRHLRRRVASLCLRLGVSNRAQAIALAAKRRLI